MNEVLNSISQSVPLPPSGMKPKIGQENSSQSGFAAKLKTAIDSVNHAQKTSDKKTEALAAGKINDLHDVLITAQKASITLETTVQVQQKMIDAYNEIMRMQI